VRRPRRQRFVQPEVFFGCTGSVLQRAFLVTARGFAAQHVPAPAALPFGAAHRCGRLPLQAQAPFGRRPMKELIQYIARSLVDHPEEVQVNEVEGEQTTVLELKVAKEDLGKVIGKQGRTARAMRTILSAASTKCKKRTVLEILE
jgi:predicted RNA-binding protein YlqC (UPF0109 family)